ncbi:rod shape-determining protein, partial [Erysipelothrix rhusiopathiae]|nr:rod shape-determining protein [Erysipelothrix rhusiopathiae]
TGGGALLHGLDELISHELSIPVYVAENALTCVAEGTGIMLENSCASVFALRMTCC